MMSDAQRDVSITEIIMTAMQAKSDHFCTQARCGECAQNTRIQMARNSIWTMIRGRS